MQGCNHLPILVSTKANNNKLKPRKMTTTKEITEAINGFLYLIAKGWNTELAFETQFDQVFDIINEEDFLNRCKNAVRDQTVN